MHFAAFPCPTIPFPSSLFRGMPRDAQIVSYAQLAIRKAQAAAAAFAALETLKKNKVPHA